MEGKGYKLRLTPFSAHHELKLYLIKYEGCHLKTLQTANCPYNYKLFAFSSTVIIGYCLRTNAHHCMVLLGAKMFTMVMAKDEMKCMSADKEVDNQ